MKTTLLKQQHEKLIKIIEMIDQINNRKNSWERDLAEYKSYGNTAWQKFVFTNSDRIEERIETCKAITSRLETYYRNQLDKIITHAPQTV